MLGGPPVFGFMRENKAPSFAGRVLAAVIFLGIYFCMCRTSND